MRFRLASKGMIEPGRGPPVVPVFGPLSGLRVLDTGRFVAGPWAATYLGEFGAEVIHLEGPPFQPPYSDPTRLLRPWAPEGATADEAVSQSWVQYARNKLSLAVDLRRPEGVDVFLDLAKVSDIWVESSRPGTYDRLNLTDQRIWSVNPRMTIVHVSGYGQTGDPERIHAPSYDLTGQAYSGFLSLQGNPPPDPPMRAGTALNDTVTGMAAAAGALMGYICAQRTGKGQAVDVAQFEVFFTLLENLALDYFLRGVVRGRHGRGHARLYPYDLYRASDGWVVVAAPTQAAWVGLRDLVGIPPAKFDELAERTASRAIVDAAIEEFTSSRSAAELEAIGRSADVAISRVYDISDIARDPHYQSRGMFVDWIDPVAGPVRGAGIAPRFVRTPGGVWRGAPWLGQDNDAVLSRMLGYSGEKISELRTMGVLGEFRPKARGHEEIPFFQRESK